MTIESTLAGRADEGDHTRRGVTAREIEDGTGLALSTVYRAIRSLEQKGILVKVPRAEDQPSGATR